MFWLKLLPIEIYQQIYKYVLNEFHNELTQKFAYNYYKMCCKQYNICDIRLRQPIYTKKIHYHTGLYKKEIQRMTYEYYKFISTLKSNHNIYNKMENLNDVKIDEAIIKKQKKDEKLKEKQKQNDLIAGIQVDFNTLSKKQKKSLIRDLITLM